MELEELVAYLDDYLAVREVPDYDNAFNGLQVEGRRSIGAVATAVDACQAVIDEAVGRQADLLLVHHGLLWTRGPITGPLYSRLAALIRSDVALYSCHLPLDAHPEVGNNHVLARRLDLTVGGRFGEHQGALLGVWCETELARDALVERVAQQLGVAPHVIATGPPTVRRVGIITGGAGRWVDRALDAGCDTFLTGEGSHDTYFTAEERGINLIYAGHYATETVGVQALGDHLADRFGLRTFFIDHPTGL